MKKIYLLLFSLFLITACEKDEPLIPEENLNVTRDLEEIPYQNLPASVTEPFILKSSLKSKKIDRSFGKFGSINTSKSVRKIQDKNGRTTFTFVMKKVKHSENSGRYFDNLILAKTDDGDFNVTLIRYTPKHGGSFGGRTNSFTGLMEFFNMDGERLGTMALENGKQVIERSVQKGFSTTCTYTFENEICSGSGATERCLITYTQSCKTTYLSDNLTRDGSDSGGGGGTGDGGTGGGGGGSSTTTSPIPDEEEIVEEDKINTDNLNNDCVEGIIEKLMQKDATLSGDLPHIAEHILNLFESSSTMSLYFESSQLGNSSAGHQINAETTSYLDGWRINLDTDLLSDATKLSIAKTVIHETVHTWIKYTLRENRTSDMVTNLNLIYQKYQNHPKAQNLTHHEFRGQFVEVFAYSLASFDGHRHPFHYYISLSWGGLETSTAYSNLRNQTDIQKIIANERFNTIGAKSSPCP